MAIFDSKYRFVWGSCGFPGNSYDAISFKSTNLWDALENGLLLNIAKLALTGQKERHFKGSLELMGSR